MSTQKNLSIIGAGAVGVAALVLGTAGIAGAQDADNQGADKAGKQERNEARRGDRQARAQSVIADLIADGTITQEQVDAADSARDILQAQREEARADKLADVAEAAGVTVEELQAAKSEGSTLAEIAGENLDGVVDLFVERSTARINGAVEAGRITQEQADERLDGLEDRIATRLEEGGGFGKRGKQKANRGDRAGQGAAQESNFSA